MSDKNSAFSEVPLGFGMALAKNADAMRYYSSLTPAEQQTLIARAHGVGSKKEMQSFISELGEKKR